MLKVLARKVDLGEWTPVKVFDLVRSRDAFLLESGQVEAGNENRGRFSIIGFDPFLKLKSKDDECFVWREGRDLLQFKGDALRVLQDLIDEFRVEDVEGEAAELPFLGGAVGYLSYDYGVKMLEVEQEVNDDFEISDLEFVFVDSCFVIDHVKGKLWLVASGVHEAECEEGILKLERVLSGEDVIEFDGKGVDREAIDRNGGDCRVFSNVAEGEFFEKIGKVKEFLYQGESYEVNFAHRFSGECNIDPWVVYQKLAQINPSGHAFYFEGEEVQVVSNSPEKLVSCVDGILETRPIKGTVARGSSPEEERRLAEELLESEKVAAELNMIVDLARNDLGQVAEAGSVKVVKHRDVEKYSHVQHTVSTIQAKKKDEAKFVDVIRALFPGGSVTGAPKKRTVEIIDELEEYRRGIYCGSAGYVSFNGDFDFNILIRTLTFKDGRVCFHVGGGIVIDSDAREEWQETLDKAGAMVKALEL